MAAAHSVSDGYFIQSSAVESGVGDFNFRVVLNVYVGVSGTSGKQGRHPVVVNRKEMEATQAISDSLLDSDDAESEEENGTQRRQPLAKLCVLKNEHIPEAEFPLFMGDNVLGRDTNACSLPLPSPSVSKKHATISISVYRRRGRRSEGDTEALVWDLESLNGTRKGHLKLTPNVRYALSDGDSLVVADIPCQYFTEDKVLSRGDMRLPLYRNVGVKATVPEPSGMVSGDQSTDSKKCANGGLKARASLTKTPVRMGCLSLEQTPIQETLVPESDPESDEERGDDKALVSESDSHKSSPTCSTFMSPTNNTVPESPITPSSFSKNIQNRQVSFSKEDTGGVKKPLAIVDDSGEEEEKASPQTTESKKDEKHVPGSLEGNDDVAGEQELPVRTDAFNSDIDVEEDKDGASFECSITSNTKGVAQPAITAEFHMDSDTDAEEEQECVASVRPVTSNTNGVAQLVNTEEFHMDSDTDVEEEQEAVVSVGPVTLNTTGVAQPPNTVEFQMDSDTDVDEDEDTKTFASSDSKTKPSHVNSDPQPEGITVGSDTALTDATQSVLPLSAPTADAAPSTEIQDFNRDSDTDVDEDIDKDCGTNQTRSKTHETPSSLDKKPNMGDSAPAAPHSLHLDSDTDDEEMPAPNLTEPPVPFAAATDVGPNILSDSDTDVEDESSLVISTTAAVLPVSTGEVSGALESHNKHTEVAGSSNAPVEDGAKPPELKLDSDADTDVEDKEAEAGEVGDDQISSLCRENTPGILVPLLQNCSTPLQGAGAPSLGPEGSPSYLDSREDEDPLAETQSFILQSRDCQSNPDTDATQAFDPETSVDENDDQPGQGGSFQLGLSDSSHLQRQAQALALESTQAFVPIEEITNLDDSQSADGGPHLKTMQACEEAQDPPGSSVVSEKEGQQHVEFEATQAYISKPDSESEDETDEEEKLYMIATAETQPLGFPVSYSLATAETQPMSYELECLQGDRQQVESITQNKTDEGEEPEETVQRQQRSSNEVLCLAETQPMSICEPEESEDEDSFPGPQKRKPKPLQIEEEQTQPLVGSSSSIAQTQPMAPSENDDTDDEDLLPRKRRAKVLTLEETQTLSNSEVCSAVCQPISPREAEQSDEDDSVQVTRKRKAKPLQLAEEDTQTPLNSELSAFETQPPDPAEEEENHEEDSAPFPRERRAKAVQIEVDSQSLGYSQETTAATQPISTKDGDDLIQGPRKRKAKALHLEEETQSTDTEPIVMDVDEESDAKDLIPGPRERKEKTIHTQDEDTGVSTIFEVPVDTVVRPLRQRGTRSEAGARGVIASNKRGTRARSRGNEERADCSEPPKRQTRGRNKALDDSRGSNGRSKSANNETEEEEAVLDGTSKTKNPTRRQRGGKEVKEKSSETEKRELEERLERAKENEEQLQREAKEKEERLLAEAKEKEERERLQEEAKKKEQERLQREAKEKEEQEQLQKQAKEERERLQKDNQTNEKENTDESNEAKVSARGRRAARRTNAEPCSMEQSSVSPSDDVPARRTRSRSNSSNSISSERSAPSISTQQRGGRGRGRGGKRMSERPQTTISRSSNGRRTVAADRADEGGRDVSPQGVLSRSNSTSSLNSEISSSSASSLNRGRGGRQRGRPRTTEAAAPVSGQSGQNSSPKPAARGRKGRKTEGAVNAVTPEEECEQSSTTRGQRRATTTSSESVAADKGNQSTQEESHQPNEQSHLSKRNARVGPQQSTSSGTVAAGAVATSDADEAKDKRRGKKRELEPNREEESGSGSKVLKVKDKTQTSEAAEEEEKDEIPVQAKRRSRASAAQAKKSATVSPPEVEVKEEKIEEVVEKRGRGRSSVVQRNRREQQEESETSTTSLNQSVEVEPSETTTTSSASRKRPAPVDSSPVAKTSRSSLSSSSSPTAASPVGRGRVVSQAFKVLFTGVEDEGGERVLARLGGSMAKGVADMNCLVTDKVRRTVKFLCAMAKGVPIVTTQWLEKSAKAGRFLSPDAFLVKDAEQEKKFTFCLLDSLGTARSRPLFQGYEIHVTKSVKPEPVHMKDIISCSGATFLAKMPSSHKPQTVVISCEEDLASCRPAFSASLPVVTAEFILTGILQQKVDFQTHSLSAAQQQPAGGSRGRGRKKP